MKILYLLFKSVHEWARQYICRDGIYFSFAYIRELFAASAGQLADDKPDGWR